MDRLLEQFDSQRESDLDWMSDLFHDLRNPLLPIKHAARYFPPFLCANGDFMSKLKDVVKLSRLPKMKKRIHSLDGMTESGAVALWLYTHDGFIYRDLNMRLRAQETAYLQAHYFPYLRILLTALKCLQPPKIRTVFKGLKANVMKEAEDAIYQPGKTFVWGTFSSVTVNRKILESDQCLGQEGVRTIFEITTNHGSDVGAFFGWEDAEVVIPPGCVMRVVNIEKKGDLTVIQCEHARMIH